MHADAYTSSCKVSDFNKNWNALTFLWPPPLNMKFHENLFSGSHVLYIQMNERSNFNRLCECVYKANAALTLLKSHKGNNNNHADATATDLHQVLPMLHITLKEEVLGPTNI